jgi:hypothetical protein
MHLSSYSITFLSSNYIQHSDGCWRMGLSGAMSPYVLFTNFDEKVFYDAKVLEFGTGMRRG